jgi:uncharacterized membrane protein
MNEEFDWDMETILKRLALWGGIALAIISVYFSYDGADQTINGGNPAYSEVAKYIMIVMALVITLAQFIFNSDFAKLSTTMKIIGALSYVYSLSTNYMGIQHLFGFSGFVGGMIAAFMDIAPEAFIAWSLDDSLRGDMIGNLSKMFMGVGRKSRRNQSTQNRPQQSKQYTFTPEQKHTDTKPRMPAVHMVEQARKGKGRGFYENQKQQNQKPASRFEGLFKDDE